jgi:DNA-binding NtrC family response regulator
MTDRILIVDDERGMCDLLQVDLGLRGFDVVCFTDAETALLELDRSDFAVVLTDLSMPGVDGAELCERIVGNRPDIPVVVMTAFGSLETATAAIRAGAWDFVTKPVELDLLAITLERAVRHHHLQSEVRVLSRAVEQSERFDELLGTSPSMQRLFEQLDRLRNSDSRVLLTGESGTGKALADRVLHRNSDRAERPFVEVNCAAKDDDLLAVELFGHASDEFRPGAFQQADGGTLFLDGVGGLPPAIQSALIDTLQQRTVRPVGAAVPSAIDRSAVDMRVISATHRDLEAALEDGSFNRDLYFPDSTVFYVLAV